MNKLAVYAGTFDPITFGHIDIIERAARLFDQIVVAVARNKAKTPLFSLEERIALNAKVLKAHSTVSVQGFDILTLDFAKQVGANVLIRGLRAVADFDYEFQLASMNRVLSPTIETIFLMPAEKYTFISSSLIREIASLGGDITPFAPTPVVEAVIYKVSQSRT
jgi:pantetheine-phosphate adenylyltransferase